MWTGGILGFISMTVIGDSDNKGSGYRVMGTCNWTIIQQRNRAGQSLAQMKLIKGYKRNVSN